jgi:hypothetical protein
MSALCRECGQHPVRRAFPYFEKACQGCQEALRRKNLRKAQRAYVHRRYARYRAAGGCGWCGEPCGRNPGTGKPFALCFAHRLEEAARRKVAA